MKLYLASGNQHKADEIQAALKVTAPQVQVLLPGGGMPFVVEDADTFDGNAALKAEVIMSELREGEWVMADDSGLVVDALDGKPGVYSSRYAGENADDHANMDKLLDRLSDVADGERNACFVCCIMLMDTERNRHVFYGECEGVIAKEKSGSHGFGYDPIFIPNGYDKSFAELGDDVKSKISHRAIALSLLANWVNSGQK